MECGGKEEEGKPREELMYGVRGTLISEVFTKGQRIIVVQNFFLNYRIKVLNKAIIIIIIIIIVIIIIIYSVMAVNFHLTTKEEKSI